VPKIDRVPYITARGQGAISLSQFLALPLAKTAALVNPLHNQSYRHGVSCLACQLDWLFNILILQELYNWLVGLELVLVGLLTLKERSNPCSHG
jgi:hypothetical protein